MFNSRRGLMLAGTLTAFSLLAPGGASAAEFTLRMQTFIPPVANPAKTFLIPWAKKVEAASKGRIKIQPFWVMQLGGKAPQLTDQVRDGVVDIVWTLPGFTPGRMPLVEAFELPFVHRNAVSTTLALQDYQAKYLKKEFKDFKVLLLHSHGGFLFQTKKPILTLADLKGVKLRAASRTGVWLLEALGATGVGAPLPQIPPMLSKGVIDGVTLPYEIAPSVKMHELVSHFTELSGEQPRLGTNVFSFLMNKKSYNKLPGDLRKVIDGLSGRYIAKAAGENWDAIEIPGKKVMMSKEKNQFHTMSPEETAKIKAAAIPVMARWITAVDKTGANGAAMLADARALITKYNK